MAVKFTNNAATTLAAGINSSATSISVTDGSVFPSLSSGEHFYCTFDDTTNVEIVKVTARSSNTLTVVRGQDDTTARAFSSGDKAELRVVAALLEDVKTEVTSTLSVDTFTGDDSTTAFTLSQAPASEDNLIVFIEGVYQNPGDFTLSGTTLTLDSAPVASRKIVVYHVSGAVSGNNLNHDQFTANGSTAAFTLSISPIHENNTQVFIDGVYQQKDSYAVSGTTLTLDANPANGAIVEVMTFTQTDVNTIPASFVAGLTEVSAVGTDHLLVYDATDNALKKALASDLIETVGSTPTFTTANITNTTTGDSLLFTTTEDSSTAAPVITLKRNSGSPADADYLGQLKFKGENDADQEVIYAKITSKIQDASDGSEDGLLEFANIKAGSQTITARLKSDKLQLLNSTGLEVAGLTYPTSDGTNGQALVTDGSGNLSFSTVSGGVTGISSSADATAIYINSSEQVSLGTSSPDSLFHVESSSTTAITIQAGTNSSASLRLKNDAVDWDVNCQTNDNFAIYNQTASAERLVIDGSGFVGFGGATPSSYNSAAQNLVVASSGNTGISIVAGTSSDSTLMFADGTGGTAGYRGRVGYDHAIDAMNFHTSAAQHMRIQSDGIVVISSGYETFVPTIKHGGATGDLSKLRVINRSGQSADKGGLIELGGVTDDGVSRSDVFGAILGGKTNATSGNRTGYLAFYTNDGDSIEKRLVLDASNNMTLHSTTGDTTIKFYEGSTIKWWVQNDTGGSPGSDSFWIGDEENDNGVYVVQDGSSWGGISDERLKRNWTNLTGACDKLDTLTKVGTFNRRGKTTGKWSDNKEVGLSAQEVEAILPEAVNTGGDIEFASDDKVTGVKGMSYEKLVPLLVKAIQELNTRLKAVE